jgi:hypothetical protein
MTRSIRAMQIPALIALRRWERGSGVGSGSSTVVEFAAMVGEDVGVDE